MNLKYCALLTFCLTGCQLLSYSGHIEQGQGQIAMHTKQLTIGMNKEAVTAIMGVPNVVAANTPDQWTFIHSTQKGHQAIQVDYVNLTFNNGHLTAISPIKHG